MKNLFVLFAFVSVICAQSFTTTSVSLQNGLTMTAQQNGFTFSGKVSRSTFSFFMGSFNELDSAGVVVRNSTFGTTSIGGFSEESTYWTATGTTPVYIYDIGSSVTFDATLLLQVNVYTANSVYQWNGENISCPAGSVKLIPTISWITPLNLDGDYMSFTGSASWDISALDVAEALQDGISYTPEKDNGNQIGATIGINGGISIYFTFPGSVDYGLGDWGTMKYSMSVSDVSLSSSASYTVIFNSISDSMTFDPVLHLAGNGAGSLAYSLSLILLIVAFFKLF